jgi:hypothetical protein
VTLTLTLVFFALLIGYALGKTAAPSLHGLDKHLEDIHASLEQLRKENCVVTNSLTKARRLLAESGGELTEEDLDYDGGSLKRIEHAISSLADRVVKLAEASKKTS